MRAVRAIWLGRRRYAAVHELQFALHAARRARRTGDIVLFLEHDPVITLGRGSHIANILAPEQALRGAGIDVESTGRGGDVTLHAPGQLVAYPILDLNPDRRDVRRYVQDLTLVMQRTVADVGVAGGPIEGMVGLWVDASTPARWLGRDAARSPAKVGAIGVRMSHWVTMHGFALNVSNDLGLYRYIVPCGITAYPVTSLLELTGDHRSVHAVAAVAVGHFAGVFSAELGDLRDCSSIPLEVDRLLEA